VSNARGRKKGEKKSKIFIFEYQCISHIKQKTGQKSFAKYLAGKEKVLNFASLLKGNAITSA